MIRRLAAALACALGLQVLAAPAAQAGWRPVDFPRHDVTLRAVAVDGQRIAVSGAKGAVGISDDGGRTWRLASVAGGEALDFRGLALTGAKSIVLMSAGDGAAGQARLYRSDDDGRSWTLAHETRTEGAFFDTVGFRDRKRGLVLGDPLDGGWFVLRTADGGGSWARVAARMPPLLAGEAAFAASNSALILGGRGRAWIVSGGAARGRVFRSTDGGATWQVADTPIAGGPTGGVFGGLWLGGSRVVVVGGDHKDELRGGTDIAVSDDGGATWTAAAAAGRLLEGVGRLDATTLIAVGPRGTVVSRDNGRTWTATDAEAFHTIACDRSRCVAAGANGRVAIWD